MCKEIVPVYSDDHKKPVNALCGKNAELLIVTADGTYTSYSCHWLKSVKKRFIFRIGFTFNASEIYFFMLHYNY
jgi:hypothetical protein